MPVVERPQVVDRHLHNGSMKIHPISHPLGAHAAQTWQARTAAERQHHRLNLILGVLGQGNIAHLPRPVLIQSILESLVPRTTSSVLWALTHHVGRIHPHDSQRDCVGLTKRLGLLLKISCRVLQPMVDVNGSHESRPLLLASP